MLHFYSVLLALVVCGKGAAAESMPEEFERQVWLSPGIYSRHFDRDKGLREDNVGLGLEVRLAQKHAAMAGSFINSNRARSRYAGYYWRPLGWRVANVEAGAGILMAAFDGYPGYRDGAWFFAPLPVFSLEGRLFGVHLTAIPTLPGRLDGAVAAQFKLRIW